MNQTDKVNANKISVLELAKAIGDDWLQKKAQGRATPESFTHGTSDQRKR